MESGVLNYKEKIKQMEQEYKSMQEELTSEIKLLSKCELKLRHRII